MEALHMEAMFNTTTPDLIDGLIVETNRTLSPPFLILLARQIDIVLTPIIIIIGLVGNGVTIAIFMSPSLRLASCSLYLSTRACSDISFLLSLGVVWIDTMGAKLLRHSFICHLVVYVTYVSSFLSAWLVCLVTFENFIRIRCPYRVPIYCTLYKARCSVILFFMISLFIYGFTLGTVTTDSNHGCVPRQDRAILMETITYIDAVVALVFPTLVIFLMVFTTCHRVVTRPSNREAQPATIGSRLQTQVIRLLFAVSIAFLVFNVPSYVIKIHYIIQSTILHQRATVVQHVLQILFNLLFYCSFSVNILIYLAFGRNFRKVCLAVLTKRYCLPCRGKNGRPDSVEVEFSDYPTMVVTAIPSRKHSDPFQNGLGVSKHISGEFTSLV